MALADNDRISSNALNTVISALWTKIKSLFLTKSDFDDSPAGKILEVEYGSSTYTYQQLKEFYKAGYTVYVVSSVDDSSGSAGFNKLRMVGYNDVQSATPTAYFFSEYNPSTNASMVATLQIVNGQERWNSFVSSLSYNSLKDKAHSHNAVDIVNVDLSGLTTTIAAEIQDRYPAQYIRMSTNSNNDARNIDDKPSSGWGFFAEASLVKNAGSGDYTYIVHAYAVMRKSNTDDTNVADTNGYVCEVGPGTSRCLWGRMLEPTEAYEDVGSDTQIPVITTNKYGQIVAMHTVTVKGGGGGSDPGSEYAKKSSYNTFMASQELKRETATKVQIIIRNSLRDLRIGVDEFGQFYCQDYADRSYNPGSNFNFMETTGTGADTQYLFHGRADTANMANMANSANTANAANVANVATSAGRAAVADKLNTEYNVGDSERPVYIQDGVPLPCTVGFKVNEMATTGNYISFV